MRVCTMPEASWPSPSVGYLRHQSADVVPDWHHSGVSVGRLDLDLDLVAYVAHPRMTAEHVASLPPGRIDSANDRRRQLES
jgi:hypothetical protein